MTTAFVSGPAWGDGLATFLEGSDDPLEVLFPSPALGEPPAGATSMLAGIEQTDPLRRTVRRHLRVTVTDLAAAPVDVGDAYLRLHLLSHRLVQPNTVNLTGIFSVLANVAWTNLGPVPAGDVEELRLRAALAGTRLSVDAVDKFPRMTDYVVPSGVRIAHADQVRLGAHLAPGTTVMHGGFVNFNAGTLGTSMVEGRISQGVVVGDGSDIGGGASIMGTLSGGGTEVIAIGRECLLGANAGLGISLGDRCVVEAGLYLTAGAPVRLPDGSTSKARDLSGRDDLLFRRNTLTGVLEVLPRGGAWAGGLNVELHANQ